MGDLKGKGLAEFLAGNAERILLGVLAIAVFAVLVVAGTYVVHFWGMPLADKGDVWGQFGDYLGGVLNPVFGFLSVFALLVALVLQTRELKLSRDALEVSQREQAKSAEALALQNKAIQRQSFEQTFFAWLGTYRSNVDDVAMKDYEGEALYGRVALLAIHRKYFHEHFVHQGALCGRNLEGEGRLHPLGVALKTTGLQYLREARIEHFPILGQGAMATWDLLYEDHESSLGSFFRVLYRLIRWIDEQDMSDEDKWLYVGIVRSQLSWIEMVFLFFNGMSHRGSNFKPLIERYALFDNFTTHTDRLLTILRQCPMDAVGYAPMAFSSDEARKTASKASLFG